MVEKRTFTVTMMDKTQATKVSSRDLKFLVAGQTYVGRRWVALSWHTSYDGAVRSSAKHRDGPLYYAVVIHNIEMNNATGR